MGRGYFVETVQHPQWDSVNDYKKYLKYNSPNTSLWKELYDPDIECTCCTQEAPSEAAALMKVEDQTSFTKKFGVKDITPDGKIGETMWLCADCYNNGVRPKYVYFGDIKWNKQGRRIKRRAESKGGNPWV
jgi:hypothetical protein